eukprot:2770561-Pyramimonas_sp.AAC.1
MHDGVWPLLEWGHKILWLCKCWVNECVGVLVYGWRGCAGLPALGYYRLCRHEAAGPNDHLKMTDCKMHF